ncbi:MAG: hypothetical protein HY288_13295 [Planctomycetia bacterium]|nr:hypothetical protein [Planctomycetia bacterium]
MDLSISPDLERLIAEQAVAMGFASPEEFLRALVTRDSAVSAPSELSNAEFLQLWDSLASDEEMPSLPADFSRADIYADHD